MDGLGSILLFVLPLMLLFLVMSRARKQQRALVDTQAAVQPGNRVITTAGLHARVVEVDGDVLVLETGPGQHSRWARQSIGRIVPEPAAADPERRSTEENGTL